MTSDFFDLAGWIPKELVNKLLEKLSKSFTLLFNYFQKTMLQLYVVCSKCDGSLIPGGKNNKIVDLKNFHLNSLSLVLKHSLLMADHCKLYQDANDKPVLISSECVDPRRQ